MHATNPSTKPLDYQAVKAGLKARETKSHRTTKTHRAGNSARPQSWSSASFTSAASSFCISSEKLREPAAPWQEGQQAAPEPVTKACEQHEWSTKRGEPGVASSATDHHWTHAVHFWHFTCTCVQHAALPSSTRESSGLVTFIEQRISNKVKLQD